MTGSERIMAIQRPFILANGSQKLGAVHRGGSCGQGLPRMAGSTARTLPLEMGKETRGRNPPPARLLHLLDKHTCLEACRFLGTLWATRVRSCSQGFAIVLCQPCTISVFIFANMTQLKGNRICTFHIMSGKMNAVRRMILT